VTPGEALTLRIGGSGGAGDGAGVYPNINSMAGGAISGGDGMGWSGGGGGRSELLRGATRLLVAAGGGGGGGAGQLCFGTTSIDPSLVLAGYLNGAAGGTHGYDYEGGTAGGGGSSFVVAGGTVISGSGATAANQADAYYASSIGRGGPASTAANTAGVNGGNGRIALVW
jgi:hypothetical protein